MLLPLLAIFISCGANTQNPPEDTSEIILPPISTSGNPAVNPYLAGEKYAMSHFDPSQSDAFPYPVQRGTFNVDPRAFERVVAGPVNIMQMISTDPKYMWAASSGSVNYVDASNGGWEVVASINIPNTKVISAETLNRGLDKTITTVKQAEDIVFKDWGTDWSRMANNTYMFVDKDNVMYASAGAKYVHAYGLVDPTTPTSGIKVLRTLDFSETLKKVAQNSSNPSLKSYGAIIAGVSLTYDGKLVVLTNGSISVVDRQFADLPQTVYFGGDEFVSNSMAIDEHNGIYVASDKKMYKLVWTGSKLSNDQADGAWSSPYDFGQEPPSVKLGSGTGSTPTLMGFGNDQDKLVVITDGANRMNLVAFWRDAIPADAVQQANTKSNRIAGQIRVTCGLDPMPEFIQSEQSVVVNGYGAFVVNNIRKDGHKDKLVDVLAGGPVYAPPMGAERCEWDPSTNKWRSVWSRNDVVGTSMVPAMSSASNIVLINGYTKRDGWEVTGMDWNTGSTVSRTVFGHDNLGNGAYAIIQYLPNGDLLFNSIGGPVRVKYDNPPSASVGRSN